METLPIYISELDFETFILPKLTHKTSNSRQKVSNLFIFNTIIHVLKNNCAWRTLQLDKESGTWNNIYYHYSKWAKDGSFRKVLDALNDYDCSIRANLECLEPHSKKGRKWSHKLI
ncbi:transposase [Arcicella sp. LKC2W]|uniref:transposase n=1 Tax=Arcicella sp. LKC2W TaxID=2984198 RepID=UPI002B21F95F|nr:transposase [Arcicella sp. LKC2W]MEA5461772.1 transposase [Arcicella sp. LKC2W]